MSLEHIGASRSTVVSDSQEDLKQLTQRCHSTRWYSLVNVTPSGDVGATMKITIKFERGTDGRWMAEVPEFSGAMAYGSTKFEARAAVLAVAREVAIAQMPDCRVDEEQDKLTSVLALL